jgi:hypothetical protein
LIETKGVNALLLPLVYVPTTMDKSLFVPLLGAAVMQEEAMSPSMNTMYEILFIFDASVKLIISN